MSYITLQYNSTILNKFESYMRTYCNPTQHVLNCIITYFKQFSLIFETPQNA